MTRIIFFLGILIFFLSCKEKADITEGLKMIGTTLLCTNCQSPNIHKVGSDLLLITYIQSEKYLEDQLIMQSIRQAKMSEPLPIARGKNWFINWADIPSIVSLNSNGTLLMAQWLQMSAEGTYDYDVRCAISKDSGLSWEDSFVLHDDKMAAEHGFVTMVSEPNGAFITWLDGRNTKTPLANQKIKEKNEHDHSHGANVNMPMTLRASWLDREGKKYNTFEVDNRVCDCCQTDAVMTSSGPIIVYRDRTEDEIRDISIARYVDKKWTHKALHKDNWKISGCPVNGPSVAYQDGLLAVTWFTQMNDISKVFLAISRDDGLTFEDPILIAQEGTLGRVDVAIDPELNVIITWMEDVNEETFISSRIYSTSTSRLSSTQQMIKTSSKRSAGFPIIEISENELFIVRTKLENEEKSVVLERFSW